MNWKLNVCALNVSRENSWTKKWLTLKMVTPIFVETLINFQHPTWLIPENRSYTQNSSHEKQKLYIVLYIFM